MAEKKSVGNTTPDTLNKKFADAMAKYESGEITLNEARAVAGLRPIACEGCDALVVAKRE